MRPRFTLNNESAGRGAELIRHIMLNNHRSRDGKLYVTVTLFTVLSEITDMSAYTIRVIDGIKFLEIGSIPEDLRNELGFYETKSRSRLYEEEEELPNLRESTEEEKAYSYAQSDIKRALGLAKKYIHEFSDYFTDPGTINKKSRTLSILITLSEGEKTRLYFEAAFKILRKKNVSCDLPLENFEDFYSKFEWYFRIGPVNGLLNNLSN